VINYLGKYTHRIAISNHRIIRMDGKTSVSATTPVLKCPTAYFSKASEPEVLSACLSFGIDDFGVPFWGTGSYN